MKRTKRTLLTALGVLAFATTAPSLIAGPAPGATTTERQANSAPVEAAVDSVTRHPNGMLSLVVGPQNDAALHAILEPQSDGAPAKPVFQCSEEDAGHDHAGTPAQPPAGAEKE